LRKSGEYIFRNVPRNEIQGITAAKFIFTTLGKKNVAILKKNDDYATNLAKSFQAEFQKLGGVILLNEAYEADTRDFRGIVAKIKAVEPQAVYIPGNYQEVALFLKQAYEGGLKSAFVGGDGSYSPELIKLAGNAAEGTCYTIMAVKHNDYYKSFNEAFKKKYQREPDVYDAYAYEAGSIILEAVKNVGYDATKIKDYLLSHTFNESLTGPLKFDQDGEVDRQYGIVKVQDGKFVDLE
jgi:branched-chain amino acid transport system substrate-binding protein